MLPTIEQCQSFLQTVNKGRVEFGLDPLEYLDFDNAVPTKNDRCLSATNLTMPIGEALGQDIRTLTDSIHNYDDPLGSDACGAAMRLALAMGMEAIHGSVNLDENFMAVTDAFDGRADGLRELLVQAGVVEPMPDPAVSDEEVIQYS